MRIIKADLFWLSFFLLVVVVLLLSSSCLNSSLQPFRIGPDARIQLAKSTHDMDRSQNTLRCDVLEKMGLENNDWGTSTRVSTLHTINHKIKNDSICNCILLGREGGWYS